MVLKPERSFLIVLLVLLIGALGYGSLSAAIAHVPQRAANGSGGYALIITNNRDITSTNRARDYAVLRGARIAILSPPNVMLGWVPEGIEKELIGSHGIEAVIRGHADAASIKNLDRRSRPLVSFFNSISAVSSSPAPVPSLQSHPSPLINDVLERPRSNSRALSDNQPGVVAESRAEAPQPGTSDKMTGSIAVALFFIESDGTVDPDTYSWNATDEQETFDRAVSGLSFWSDQAANYGVHLSFTLFYYTSTDTVNRQGYEPITHPQSEDRLWIDKIMENSGFSSGTTFDRVAAHNTSLREKAGTDWAYSVFVAYNPPPARTKFSDGYSAYTYLGGPYVQMLFVNDGWGKEGFGVCLGHETGHIFWACDEYYQPGYGGCTSCGPCSPSGPRPTALNANCESCASGGVSCIMKYSSPSVCPYTAEQVGWPPQLLAVSPADDLASTGTQGGPFSPVGKDYLLENTGTLSVNWKALKAVPWLTVHPENGTLTPGGRVGVTLSINETADSLPAGVYADIVTFNDGGSGSSVTRSVRLTISDSGKPPDSAGATAVTSGSSGGGGGGCFIATAAFGSSLAPQVVVFKDFRDRYLVTSSLGRPFVAAYYRCSPVLARFIGRHPAARACSRWALIPMAYALGHPIATKTGVMLFGLVSATLAGLAISFGMRK